MAGYWLLFTSFKVYDDEGYVLWSLRNYSEGGGLYERVYSQYGPFFYFYYDILHRVVSLAYDNATGRIVTLVYWLAVAGLAATLAWRITRSHLSAAAAMALTFVGLDAAMIGEPIHPGGLITFIAMAGAAVTAIGILRESPRLFAIGAGAAAGALALIKINVGAFFIIAAAGWMLLSATARPSPDGLRRAAGWLLALGCVALPLLLMRALWPMSWVTKYALVFACGSLALIPAMRAAVQPGHNLRSWGVFIGAGLIVGLVTVGVVAAGGTGLAAIWNGVVVAPLRHPTVYFFAPAWQPAAAQLAAALLVVALVTHGGLASPRIRILLAVLRVVGGACYLAGAFTAESEIMTRIAFNRGPVLAWLMAVPLAGAANEPRNQARLWLAWLFVWQTLHAYPVAGSQMGWGTFLWATLVVTGMAEALRVLSEGGGRRAEDGGPRAEGGGRTAEGGRLMAVGHYAVLAAGLLAVCRIGAVGRDFYVNSPPLRLAGAENVRPPPQISTQIRIIQENLREHAGLVFTFPGMFSQNIWSGRPTPTAANATHWFSLLTAAEQQAIIDRLEADPRALLVVHRYLIDFLVKGDFPVAGPLREYLDRAFEPVFKVGYYELHARKGRAIAGLSTAKFIPTPGGARLEVILGPENKRPIAKIAVRPLYNPAQTILTLDPATGGTTVPLTPGGVVNGLPTQISGPLTIDGIVKLILPIPSPATFPRVSEIGLVFLDAAGDEISIACFVR